MANPLRYGHALAELQFDVGVYQPRVTAQVKDPGSTSSNFKNGGFPNMRNTFLGCLYNILSYFEVYAGVPPLGKLPREGFMKPLLPACCLFGWAGGVFSVWAGARFVLLFGHGVCFVFCCLGQGHVFLAVWRGTGVHSLTGLPGWVVKGPEQTTKQKKHVVLEISDFGCPLVSP